MINLTHHSYFNLRDGGANDILEHELRIDADYFLPIDQSSIPTGEIRIGVRYAIRLYEIDSDRRAYWRRRICNSFMGTDTITTGY